MLTKLLETYDSNTKSYFVVVGRGIVFLAAGSEFPEGALFSLFLSRFCVHQWFWSNFNFLLNFSSARNETYLSCTLLKIVLYGCETWSLTLSEEHRLRVFENRVLRRIFGPKRDGITGEWRKLHNEELNDLCSSPNIVRVKKSRRMGWAGHVARMEEGRGVHKVLVGKTEGKRPFGRPRRRWENNIKMDLEEVGRCCGDWTELAEDRDRWRALVSTVMNFRVP